MARRCVFISLVLLILYSSLATGADRFIMITAGAIQGASAIRQDWERSWKC